jgi:hypothetical protein
MYRYAGQEFLNRFSKIHRTVVLDLVLSQNRNVKSVIFVIYYFFLTIARKFAFEKQNLGNSLFFL